MGVGATMLKHAQDLLDSDAIDELHRFIDIIRDNSPLSEWIAQIFVITVFSATERILGVFVREAKAL